MVFSWDLLTFNTSGTLSLTKAAGSEVTAKPQDGWIALTGDGVLVTVTLTDANQEGAVIVLGGEQQLLSFHTVYVPIVPPAQTG